MNKYIFIYILIVILPKPNFGQFFFRMKADFSVKSKSIDGSGQLTMGKVYYDINSGKIIFQNKFPEKETWVMTDTLLLKISDNKITEKKTTPALTELSIFHLTLSGNLANYGLEKSFYTLEKVEKKEELVISTWIPPAAFSGLIGKILISNKNKKLHGIIFYNAEEKIISKQFFKNYLNVQGLEFPTEIIQILYIDNDESYQVTTYKNIVVNDTNEDNMYNYPVPEY